MGIQIASTILYCRKFEETVAFYRKRIGLKVTAAKSWFVEFELNEAARLSIADAGRASVGAIGGRGVTITLKVDDIGTLRTRLIGENLDPGPVKDHPWGARVFHIRDPEGNRIEFWMHNRDPMVPSRGIGSVSGGRGKEFIEILGRREQEEAFEILIELVPHLKRSDFLQSFQHDLMKSHKLFGLRDSGRLVSVAAAWVLMTGLLEKLLWIYGFVTTEPMRSKG